MRYQTIRKLRIERALSTGINGITQKRPRQGHTITSNDTVLE